MNLAVKISALFSLMTCLTLLLSGTGLIMTLVRSVVVFLGIMILYYLTVIVLSVIKKSEQPSEQTSAAEGMHSQQTQETTKQPSA